MTVLPGDSWWELGPFMYVHTYMHLCTNTHFPCPQCSHYVF